MRVSLELAPTALQVGAESNLVHSGPRGRRGFPMCEEPGCHTEAIGPFDYACYRHWPRDEKAREERRGN